VQKLKQKVDHTIVPSIIIFLPQNVLAQIKSISYYKKIIFNYFYIIMEILIKLMILPFKICQFFIVSLSLINSQKDNNILQRLKIISNLFTYRHIKLKYIYFLTIIWFK
jgi:hypothetical protein